jgi:AcrR family transcriptional regulator
MPRRYHHGDLRRALLRSAERIIKKRGLAFVSLREVARDARVSHSAPAHHFGNKAGLLTAFAAEGFSRMADTCVAEAKKATTAPDVLEAIGRGYVRFAIENPEQFGVMFREELLDTTSPEFNAAADRAYAALIQALRRCVSEGYVHGADLDATGAAAGAIAGPPGAGDAAKDATAAAERRSRRSGRGLAGSTGASVWAWPERAVTRKSAVSG